nr:ABC transporter permease [Streptomyces sp. NBC_00886]
MTATPGADPPHASFFGEVKDAVTPRAALLVIGVVALQLLFIASYVGALHNPKPRDVPFGVVAPQVTAEQTVTRLKQLPGSPLDPRALSDAATARKQILNRDIDGTLVIDPRGTTDTLLVATGGGTVLATTLETITATLEKTEQRTIRTVDVAPASTQDFDGLSSFYLVVGWCVGGYLCASILAISTGARPANPRRAVIRLIVMALVAIVGGLGGAVIIGPILGALPGSVPALWGLGALITFAVGAATLALQGVFGIVGIGLAILLVVIAGNPSAGGAFPLPLLPPFWNAIGPAMPPGAGTWVARSIAYFKGNAVTGPLLVLSAWALAGIVVTLLAATLRRKHEHLLDRPALSDPSATLDE